MPGPVIPARASRTVRGALREAEHAQIGKPGEEVPEAALRERGRAGSGPEGGLEPSTSEVETSEENPSHRDYNKHSRVKEFSFPKPLK